MRQFWIVPGSENNWQQALMARGIWGLEDKPLDKIYWLALAPDDILLFYVTGKVKGIVGYGVLRAKFRQEVPLWDAEIKEGHAKWPLRFEFDVEFLLPQNRWTQDKIPLAGGGHFRQPLFLRERDEVFDIIKQLNPSADLKSFEGGFVSPPSSELEETSPSHEQIKKWLLDIGRFQGYVADVEFPMGTERLDAVWRRLPESVPTYVFEVQVGGDLYHALGKLKHAYDIWNSRIFLVGSTEDIPLVNKLLSGTFHEIKPFLRFIETPKIQQLHQSKRNIFDIEKQLGLMP
jgi:hypothetical protein